MDLNRNQYFLAGLVILAMGMQFRMVETVTLNKECTEFLQRRMAKKEPGAARPASTFALWGETKAAEKIPSLRTMRPPIWLGYALLSVGAVLVLHSLAMPKPE
jgi:hypothetical protein